MEQRKGADGNHEEREEETVDEKIDRLGRELQDMQKEAERMRSNSPPITRPPVPEPLLKLRRAIKEKHTERELLLEDQRVSKVAEEYLRENPSILEKVEECPICLEPIFDRNGSQTFVCCGKQVCGSCSEPLMAAGHKTCPLCREKFPSKENEVLSILHEKAACLVNFFGSD
mmetsp:Transcript_9149/g.19470  ORF Transcript_9149/g.19470 Transcript_9149/m.19470 type:complete len:172 (-) Transcript_9149:527-1042(-)